MARTRKVIILLDEYDTPMQEAYVNGYWEQMVSFMRSMFNAAFKTNPYLEVVTTTSPKYDDFFGFTEEVFDALDEFGMPERKQEVKDWYDGFTFGNRKDIYNPWSILNYLDKKQFGAYRANSSSNSLNSVGT